MDGKVTPIGVMPVVMFGRNGLQKLIDSFCVNVKGGREFQHSVAQQLLMTAVRSVRGWIVKDEL
jgi:hypothetical protein